MFTDFRWYSLLIKIIYVHMLFIIPILCEKWLYKTLPKSSFCMKYGTTPPGHRALASRTPFFHDGLSGWIIISPSCRPLSSQTYCGLLERQEFMLWAVREKTNIIQNFNNSSLDYFTFIVGASNEKQDLQIELILFLKFYLVGINLPKMIVQLAIGNFITNFLLIVTVFENSVESWLRRHRTSSPIISSWQCRTNAERYEQKKYSYCHHGIPSSWTRALLYSDTGRIYFFLYIIPVPL